MGRKSKTKCLRLEYAIIPLVVNMAKESFGFGRWTPIEAFNRTGVPPAILESCGESVTPDGCPDPRGKIIEVRIPPYNRKQMIIKCKLPPAEVCGTCFFRKPKEVIDVG